VGILTTILWSFLRTSYNRAFEHRSDCPFDNSPDHHHNYHHDDLCYILTVILEASSRIDTFKRTRIPSNNTPIAKNCPCPLFGHLTNFLLSRAALPRLRFVEAVQHLVIIISDGAAVSKKKKRHNHEHYELLTIDLALRFGFIVGYPYDYSSTILSIIYPPARQFHHDYNYSSVPTTILRLFFIHLSPYHHHFQHDGDKQSRF
jgi:hypothetical protein